MKYIISILVISLFYYFAKPLKFISHSSDLKTYSIFIVKYRWHSGIIINRSEAIAYFPFLENNFTNNKFIEIGWGDKDFYMAKDETFWLAIKAVLIPTSSVIHVHGFNENPEQHYSKNEIIELQLEELEYKSLIKSIQSSFATNSNKNEIKESIGLVTNSYFFLSNEKYHIFNTCNVWVAKRLNEAGIQVSPFRSITSNSLMKQLKRNSNLH